ncbi:hypothetical protein [Frankia sp. Cj3]|uniref:hypothetical protein n=1 Tax=Frankia sp. Cj3 TaxID=2880976 RepID=UPI001EF5A909|nr:hypothetical protein [Frankia sp. Cj3]
MAGLEVQVDVHAIRRTHAPTREEVWEQAEKDRREAVLAYITNDDQLDLLAALDV